MPISVGFWEWGCHNRGDTHINDTEILYKRQRNWAELAFANTSGIVTRGALFSYWPIRKKSQTSLRKLTCRSFLLVSKMVIGERVLKQKSHIFTLAFLYRTT